jgi:hypothetical protein
VKPRSLCFDARLADVNRLFDGAAIECELDGTRGDNTERDAAGNEESPPVHPDESYRHFMYSSRVLIAAGARRLVLRP